MQEAGEGVLICIIKALPLQLVGRVVAAVAAALVEVIVISLLIIFFPFLFSLFLYITIIIDTHHHCEYDYYIF